MYLFSYQNISSLLKTNCILVTELVIQLHALVIKQFSTEETLYRQNLYGTFPLAHKIIMLVINCSKVLFMAHVSASKKRNNYCQDLLSSFIESPIVC